MKIKPLSNLIMSFILLLITSCSFNNLKEYGQNDLSDNNLDMINKYNDETRLSFIDATIISIDSIPKHNLIRASKNNFCNQFKIMLELNILECDFFRASSSDKNTIVNAKASINEEIIFFVGVLINGNFLFKELYNAKSNTIISCIQNKDYFIFYGEFINLKNTKVFYEFSYCFKNKSILVTKPDYFYFLK